MLFSNYNVCVCNCSTLFKNLCDFYLSTLFNNLCDFYLEVPVTDWVLWDTSVSVSLP
jgi:hypothetical protein